MYIYFISVKLTNSRKIFYIVSLFFMIKFFDGGKTVKSFYVRWRIQKKIMGTFLKLTYLTDDKISINPIIK